MVRALILTNPRLQDHLRQTSDEVGLDCDVAFTLEDLWDGVAKKGFDFLISFATGVIVPADLLAHFPEGAFNIHPASPDYPGRFPHHFAKFDGVARYGATAHVMTERVDDGPIIDVELADVESSASPAALMHQSEEAGCILFRRLAKTLAEGNRPTAINIKWGKPKRGQRAFRSLCRISPLDSAETVHRKLDAVTVEGYQNAFVELHGQRFVHQGPVDPATKADDQERWSDFTEDGYRALLELAKASYRFSDFSSSGEDKHLIWRHDLDHSIERARRIAEIEIEHGVTATYMFVISLPYYNVFDPAVRRAAKEIAEMGHRIGLHFNASAYGQEEWGLTRLEEELSQEQALLGRLFQTTIDAVSFHDPMAGNMIDFDQENLAGMVNAYSRRFRESYGYCSDSNGYWRHEPIPDLLKAARHPHLQVLTHPEWWTEAAKPPRNRIEEAVLGQARETMGFYDGHLMRSGRKNLDK